MCTRLRCYEGAFVEHEVDLGRLEGLLANMGNTVAASSGPPQPTKTPTGVPPGTTLPPAPPMTAPGPQVEKNGGNGSQDVKLNPGNFEDLHRKCKGKSKRLTQLQK